MAIHRSPAKKPLGRQPVVPPVTVNSRTRNPITASTGITGNVRNRQIVRANTNIALSPEKKKFAATLRNNLRRHSNITAATNTTNIMVRPDFLGMLDMFVQELLILDLFGSVPMNSRQQLIPYFKYIAENTKGETQAGDIMNSPMVNRQGLDPNFTGRIVKNEIMATIGVVDVAQIMYTPVLPGSVTVSVNQSGTTVPYVDDGTGVIVDTTGAQYGIINYSNGQITFDAAITLADGDSIKSTYQYDNENVGPNEAGQYGAQMAKGYLMLDEFNLVATAHQIASYWSIYSAFAADKEWGTNISDMAKEAAISELTAEINTRGFNALEKAAQYKPQFNWDASPVLNASVMPSDYLNMFKLKLSQAAASVYQATNLARPNKMTLGTNVASYISMMNGFSAAGTTDTVGPYKFGTLDGFDLYVNPQQDPNKWVMSCFSSDIRRNSALYGQYMPIVNTDAIGLANMSIQQGVACMDAMEVVNPATVVSGKILGLF